MSALLFSLQRRTEGEHPPDSARSKELVSGCSPAKPGNSQRLAQRTLEWNLGLGYWSPSVASAPVLFAFCAVTWLLQGTELLEAGGIASIAGLCFE